MKGQWIPRSMECVECQDRCLVLLLERKGGGWFRQLPVCEKASPYEVIYQTYECSPSDLHQGGLLLFLALGQVSSSFKDSWVGIAAEKYALIPKIIDATGTNTRPGRVSACR